MSLISCDLNRLNLFLPVTKKNVQCGVTVFSIIALFHGSLCCAFEVAYISGRAQNHLWQIISSMLWVLTQLLSLRVLLPSLPLWAGKGG